MSEQNKITLESLGLSKKELRTLVVERIVEQMMGSGDEAESDMQRQITEAYHNELKEAVQKLADQKVLPKVEEILENVTFQETNRWGESEKPKLTMKEYLIQSAEKWMTEKVDFRGKTQSEDSYNWRANGTRVAYMIHEHLQYHIENAVKKALQDINSKISLGLQEAVKIQIQQALESLKIQATINK